MLQTVTTLLNVTLTATACLFKILKPENLANFEFVNSVSCNAIMAVLYCFESRTSSSYCFESRTSSSQFAQKPHKFQWQWSVPSLQSGGIDDESISSSDRAEYWLERTRFHSAFFNLSEFAGLGGAWVPPEGVERLGCTNPSMSTRTLPTLTAVGEPLDKDESSLEDAVFMGPAEPLGAVFKGPAEPLGPVLEGTA